MYNKTSFINLTDYAELVGLCGIAQLCGRSPITRKIMRAHNRIIPPSLVVCDVQVTRMRYVAEYLLAVLGGNDNPSAAETVSYNTFFLADHKLLYVMFR